MTASHAPAGKPAWQNFVFHEELFTAGQSRPFVERPRSLYVEIRSGQIHPMRPTPSCWVVGHKSLLLTASFWSTSFSLFRVAHDDRLFGASFVCVWNVDPDRVHICGGRLDGALHGASKHRPLWLRPLNKTTHAYLRCCARTVYFELGWLQRSS